MTHPSTGEPVTIENSLVNGVPPSEYPAGFWELLDFERAWTDAGPSTAGNPGPYLKVPVRDDGSKLAQWWHGTVHRVYRKPEVEA